MDKIEKYNKDASFSYEVFDRQLKHFCMMVQVLMDGWEDYSSQELAFDINSLCTKVSRLCYMADQDLALQHADVIHQRKEQNEDWHSEMEILVKIKFSPFVFRVLNELKEGKILQGHESPMFPSELSSIFPRIFDLLEMEGMGKEKMQQLQGIIVMGENMVRKEAPSLLSTEKPEVLSMEMPEAQTEEMADAQSVEAMHRLWSFLRLYAMTSYLLLHFRRVCHVTSCPLKAETTIRLTEQNVQQYLNSEEGKRSLDLYLSRLQYENDGKPLDIDQWLKARRELKAQVPPKFELAFLYYIDDINKAGEELANLTFTAEEFDILIDVLAKYQVITRRIFTLSHPEEQACNLPNEAFNWVVNGRSVDLLELKKSIGKMVVLVQKKNQWFCVWSVLKHLNVLRDDCTFATFAHQMMSPEWFGCSENVVPFSADNLSDYSRYFNEYDYTDWQEEIFLEKKDLYGMTKWSPKLCQNFSKLCEEMMKAIWGYSFLV